MAIEISDPKQNYGAEQWRKPTIPPEMKEVFSEPGRVIGKVTYQSSWHCVAWDEFKIFLFMFVKHGGGEEKHRIATTQPELFLEALAKLTSDERYTVIHTLYEQASDAKRTEHESTSTFYHKAFAEGRLKKRTLPKQGLIKVWVQPST